MHNTLLKERRRIRAEAEQSHLMLNLIINASSGAGRNWIFSQFSHLVSKNPCRRKQHLFKGRGQLILPNVYREAVDEGGGMQRGGAGTRRLGGTVAGKLRPRDGCWHSGAVALLPRGPGCAAQRRGHAPPRRSPRRAPAPPDGAVLCRAGSARSAIGSATSDFRDRPGSAARLTGTSVCLSLYVHVSYFSLGNALPVASSGHPFFPTSTRSGQAAAGLAPRQPFPAPSPPGSSARGPGHRAAGEPRRDHPLRLPLHRGTLHPRPLRQLRAEDTRR